MEQSGHLATFGTKRLSRDDLLFETPGSAGARVLAPQQVQQGYTHGSRRQLEWSSELFSPELCQGGGANGSLLGSGFLRTRSDRVNRLLHQFGQRRTCPHGLAGT